MVRKTGPTIGAGALTLALLAGCGTQSENTANAKQEKPIAGPAFTNVAKLADTVSDNQSAAKTSKVQLNGSIGQLRFTGDGVVDLSEKPTPAMRMNMNAVGQKMTMVLKNRVMYMKPPKQAGNEKTWTKIDGNGKDPLSHIMGKAFTQMSDSADPTTTLDRIKSTGKIVSHKPENLNGQRTNHYTVRLDSKKLFQQQMEQLRQTVGKDLPPKAKQEMDQSAAKLPKSVPADVWINDKNLPVKFSTTMPTPAEATPVPGAKGKGGKSQDVKVTATYSDWGKPVNIDVPPANKVKSFSSQLRERLKQLPGGAP